MGKDMIRMGIDQLGEVGGGDGERHEQVGSKRLERRGLGQGW